MNNIPLIVWDVDDVLNTLMHSWLNDWNSRNGSSYNYEDLKENPPHQIIGISKEKYLSDLDHFRESKSGQQVSYNPFIMKWFRENGHKFHHIACTARPLESRGFQAHWVYKNFNQWIYTVNMSNSGRDLENDKSFSKIDFLKFLDNDLLFIDDNELTINVASNRNIKTILFPQPWNSSNFDIGDFLSMLNKKLR